MTFSDASAMEACLLPNPPFCYSIGWGSSSRCWWLQTVSQQFFVGTNATDSGFKANGCYLISTDTFYLFYFTAVSSLTSSDFVSASILTLGTNGLTFIAEKVLSFGVDSAVESPLLLLFDYSVDFKIGAFETISFNLSGGNVGCLAINTCLIFCVCWTAGWFVSV